MDSISTNRNLEIWNEDDLLDMIVQIHAVTGKPVGFKAVIGAYGWIESPCKVILVHGEKDSMAIFGSLLSNIRVEMSQLHQAFSL